MPYSLATRSRRSDTTSARATPSTPGWAWNSGMKHSANQPPPQIPILRVMTTFLVWTTLAWTMFAWTMFTWTTLVCTMLARTGLVE